MKRSLTLIAVVVLLVVVSAVVFAACMPSDPTKAKEKYEKADYSVVFDNSKIGNTAVAAGIALVCDIKDGVTAKLVASNGKYTGTVIWFENSKDASAYEKYLKSNKSSDSKTYIKKDGKAVYAGDKEAYNFKKAE